MVKPIFILTTPAFVYSLPIDLTKTTLPYNEFTTGPFLMSFTSGLRDFIYGTTLNMCATQCASIDSLKSAVKCTRECFIKHELESARISLRNVRKVLEEASYASPNKTEETIKPAKESHLVIQFGG